MRVAFSLIESRVWTGGYQYLLNLFLVVTTYEHDRVTPVLFCGEDAEESDLQPFLEMPGVEVVRSLVFNRKTKMPRLIWSLVYGADLAALKVFRRYGIDVAFENAIFYGRNFPIPAIAWLPDFQHRHLRHQFSWFSYWKREVGFLAQVAAGRRIMLSSEDAAKDCMRFYPCSAGQVSTVRFAAPIPEVLIEQDPDAVRREYGLPEMFFYLPNQFWRHKNHSVVIDALGSLRQKGVNAVVAASGNPSDPRHPGYLEELKARISRAGVQDGFRLLGMVPRRHVISLMRTCAALINPSCFEGWSSTVEESRALGVRMLLSDIAVHREQMGADAHYFATDDAAALAQAMLDVIRQSVPQGGGDGRNVGNEARVKRFAKDFADVVEKAVQAGVTR